MLQSSVSHTVRCTAYTHDENLHPAADKHVQCGVFYSKYLVDTVRKQADNICSTAGKQAQHAVLCCRYSLSVHIQRMYNLLQTNKARAMEEEKNLEGIKLHTRTK